ncbi:ABC transporter permease subunit [Halotalea alkalilenta]|uniref:ABC transporter permease subunit n=1 Tax=Halotalea alkalilenta TaxID=376489 RepID=UPI0004833A67|nr:ABC transporter permease subunit [Halotalea alkalilenta]
MADIAVDSSTRAARKGGRFRPSALWLTLPGALFLVAFLLVPSFQLLSLSVEDRATGAFTLDAFIRILNGGVYTRVLFNTFLIALQTTVGCLLFGYPLAYWLARQSQRRQRLTMLFVLLPFWTSALVKNFAWLVLLGRNGSVSALLAALGMEGADSLLFNHATVVFAMVHTMLPLAVVIMLPVMNRIDANLANAAGTLGASRAQAFWRIYFPLSMPGVAAAGVLVFIASLGFFITPMLLGGARETMLGQLIIMQINQLQNWQLGSAIAVMLVVTALATCFVYDRVFGLSAISQGGGGMSHGPLRRLGHYLAGRAGDTCATLELLAARLFGQGRLDWILSTYAWLLIALLLLPIIALVPMAFTDSTFLSFPPQQYSTRWFSEYLNSPLWVSATLRSFAIGLSTALLTVLIATLAALGLARTQNRLSGLVFLLFMAPMIVPPIVIAIALFYLFAKFSLVATDLGIVIGHTVIALPITFVILLATFKGHDWRLEQAAATLGASPWRTLLRVTLPLVKGGLLAGLVTAFLQSFEELTVAMFIGGGMKTTLPKQMWDDVLLQVSPILAAASVVVLLIVTTLFFILERARPAQR